MMMKIPLVMAVVAGFGFTAASTATKWYVEPKVEERPVVERRLVCPEGYDLFELNKPYVWSSGGSLTWSNGTNVLTTNPTPATLAMADKKGDVWVQGSTPDAGKHVCVKGEKKDE